MTKLYRGFQLRSFRDVSEGLYDISRCSPAFKRIPEEVCRGVCGAFTGFQSIFQDS